MIKKISYIKNPSAGKKYRGKNHSSKDKQKLSNGHPDLIIVPSNGQVNSRKNGQNIPTMAIILNATNIGKRLNGISIYSLNILKSFAKLERGLRFIVYLNKTSKPHINLIDLPPNFTIKWISGFVSPDYGFKGHILRLIFTNYLSLKHNKSLIVNTSQLEVCFFRSNQMITIHDIIPLVFPHLHKKQYFYFKYVIQFAIKYAKKIITPSQHSKEMLMEYYKVAEQKIKVIYNGIDKMKLPLSPGIKERPFPYILFVGRFCPMKNICAILKAFELIKKRIPHYLVMAGEGEQYMDKVLKAVKLSTSDAEDNRVIIRGYISEKEKKELFRQASLFVFPSFYEGFGLPPLEAMASGCPVVTSDAGSLPEVCAGAAYCIKPWDLKNFAEGMVKVLTDSKLRCSLILKGFARSDSFCWEKSAQEHLNIIRQITFKESALLKNNRYKYSNRVDQKKCHVTY